VHITCCGLLFIIIIIIIISRYPIGERAGLLMLQRKPTVYRQRPLWIQKTELDLPVYTITSPYYTRQDQGAIVVGDFGYLFIAPFTLTVLASYVTPRSLSLPNVTKEVYLYNNVATPL
jgi:hypothetical protein